MWTRHSHNHASMHVLLTICYQLFPVYDNNSNSYIIPCCIPTAGSDKE